MIAVLLVALGGAAGAVARHALVVSLPARFPWAILAVNVVGSFLAGVLMVAASAQVLLLAGVGFCGALTTYSTFALDTMALAREGRRPAAVANIAVSLAACIVAVVLGIALARGLGVSG
jgi:CrcB protein